MTDFYYDRDGKPITSQAYGILHRNLSYKTVARTWLPRAGYLVSTVWLGLDHSFMQPGPPLIFESIVFKADDKGNITDDFDEKDIERYATDRQAIEGHIRLVNEWWDVVTFPIHKSQESYREGDYIDGEVISWGIEPPTPKAIDSEGSSGI